MKTARIVLGLSLLFLALYCPGRGPDSTKTRPREVSLVQLLANPEKFHGKRVSVRGFYHRSFESYGLYLSSECARYRITESGIWVWNIADWADTNRIEAVNDDYVLVEGTFLHTPKGGGHMGLWPSELRDLTHFTRVPRSDPK